MRRPQSAATQDFHHCLKSIPRIPRSATICFVMQSRRPLNQSALLPPASSPRVKSSGSHVFRISNPTGYFLPAKCELSTSGTKATNSDDMRAFIVALAPTNHPTNLIWGPNRLIPALLHHPDPSYPFGSNATVKQRCSIRLKALGYLNIKSAKLALKIPPLN